MAGQNTDEERIIYMVGDPHYAVDIPVEESSTRAPEAEDPVENLVEEEPEEEPEAEENPGEDSEEYQPYGNFDLDEEVIPEDAQAEEDPTSQRSPHSPGQGPIRDDMAPGRIIGHPHGETFSYEPLPIGGDYWETFQRFQMGESSRAPPPIIPDPTIPTQTAPVPPITASLPNVPTITQFSRVVNRVIRLEEREEEESDAIQTLYHRMGATRTHANTMGAHLRSLQYRLELTEAMLRTARQEIRNSERARIEASDRVNELVRYVRRRLE